MSVWCLTPLVFFTRAATVAGMSYECAQAGPSLFLADHQDDRRPDQPYVDPPVAAEDMGGNSQGCGVCGEAQRPVAEGAWS